MTRWIPTISPHAPSLEIKPRSLFIPKSLAVYMRPLFTRKPQKEFVLDQGCSLMVELLLSTHETLGLIPRTAKKKGKRTHPNSHSVPKWTYDTLKKLPLSKFPFCKISWGILTQFCNQNSCRTGLPAVGLCSLSRPQKQVLEFQTQSSCVCELSLLALFFQVHLLSVTTPAKLIFCWLLSVLGVASCLSYHPLLTAHCSGLQTGHLPTTLASGQTFLYTADLGKIPFPT